MVADQMSARGNSNTHTMGEALVVFTPSFARILAAQGWTRERVQEQLWHTAGRRLGDIRLAADGSPAVDPASHYEWWPGVGRPGRPGHPGAGYVVAAGHSYCR